MSRSRIFLAAIAALSGISVLCVAFGVGWWPLEPLTAFLMQATLALIFISFLGFRAKRYGAGSILAALALVGVIQILPFARNEHTPLTHSSCCVYVNVGHANLFTHGHGVKRLSRWAAKKNIHILELTEIPYYAANIVQEFPQYPYILAGAQHGRRKTLILSKFPMEAIPTGSDAILAATAHIKQDVSLAIISTHPTIAITPQHMQRRDTAITAVFAEAEKHSHAIVIGDFNTAPWSPILAETSRRYDFKRSSGGVFQSTWITPLPLFGLPIDHVFASYQVGIYQSGIGPFIFSDHWPIYATISIPTDAERLP